MSFDQSLKARALAILTLGLIFGSGFGIGLAVERDLVAGTPDAEEVSGDDGDERRGRRGLIVDQVDLTPEQKVQIDSTVEALFAEMGAINDEFRAIEKQFNGRIRTVIREGREDIKAFLTEEQKVRYEALLREDEERRRERRRDEHRKRDRDDPIP